MVPSYYLLISIFFLIVLVTAMRLTQHINNYYHNYYSCELWNLMPTHAFRNVIGFHSRAVGDLLYTPSIMYLLPFNQLYFILSRYIALMSTLIESMWDTHEKQNEKSRLFNNSCCVSSAVRLVFMKIVTVFNKYYKIIMSWGQRAPNSSYQCCKIFP